MAEKHLELRNPRSCLNKARPDEPIFVLRANDPLAAQIVRLWVAAAAFVHEPEKCDEAMRLAEEMQKWHEANVPQPINETMLPKDVRGAGMGQLLGQARANGYAPTSPF